MRTTTITVTNLKGGSGKTTTAANLAHAAGNLGLKVLAVDSDPQASLLEWSRLAAWEIPVIALAKPSIAKDLAGLAGARYDVIIIDTPPAGGSLADAAMKAADQIVIPVAPTTAEVNRVKHTYDAAQAAGARSPMRVLLNRCIPNARSTADARDVLAGNGWNVMAAEIPRREALAQGLGGPVDPSRGYHGYTSVIREVLA